MNRIELTSERGRGRGTVAARTRRLRPSIMALEGRTLLSTFTVTSTDDSAPAGNPTPGTLRWAVQQADMNDQADTIVFSSLFNTPQTIALDGGTLQLTDTAKTTFTGPGANLLTVDASSGTDGPVFEVTKGAVAALSGLTITGGYANDAGGGVFNDDGQLTMTERGRARQRGGQHRQFPGRRRPGHLGRRHDHAFQLHDQRQRDLGRRQRL